MLSHGQSLNNLKIVERIRVQEKTKLLSKKGYELKNERCKRIDDYVQDLKISLNQICA